MKLKLLSLSLLLVLGPLAFAQGQRSGKIREYVIDHIDGAERKLTLIDNNGSEQALTELNAHVLDNLHTGDLVSLNGQNNLATGELGVSSVNFNSAAVAPPPVSGSKTVLQILVNFADTPSSQPFTLAHANDVLANTTNAWDLQNSYGNLSLAVTSIGWYTVGTLSTDCSISTIASQANTLAANNGINPANYNYVMYVMSANTGCSSWWGQAIIGGNQTWINGEYGIALHVTAHEMGHNFGLYHSHYLDCSATVLCAVSGGVVQDYGDYIDTMGANGNSYSGHFSTPQKEALGWMAGAGLYPTLQTVTVDGTYTIHPLESQTLDVKGLKIPAAGGYYYLEYRQATGFDSYLSSLSPATNSLTGVEFHWSTGNNVYPGPNYLLDLSPNSVADSSSIYDDPDFNDGSLQPTIAYTDSAAGVTITPAAGNGSGIAIAVAFTCTRANPGVVITPSSSPSLAAGSQQVYSVAVTNTDSAHCPSSSFTVVPTAPGGWTATTPAGFTLAPQAAQTVTANVTSPTSAGAGANTISYLTTDVGSGDATTSTVTYNLGASLTAVVTADHASYTAGQTINVTVTLTAGGVPATGVAVAVKINKGSHNKHSNFTGTTNGSGVATFAYTVANSDPKGGWTITASATSGALTSFDSIPITVN